LAAESMLEIPRVLAVECLRSTHPVYLKRENEELFFVRAGPLTQSLSMSEMVAYLEQRKKEEGEEDRA
jgi:hypothetical protein